ncbi:hypothetical protein LTR41_010969 [Exophiala xenobiotica]|nr:hypothetical protein LTR41_010969 [Exophiala xenobiotica]KAK5551137.1 hypothetical protein LTR46_010890 [Exophiala xenobiotica]
MKDTYQQGNTVSPVAVLPFEAERQDGSISQSTSEVPEGGFGWAIAFSCSMMSFWMVGISNSWGVLQTALLETGFGDASASSLSFIGAFSNTWIILLGPVALHALRYTGCRLGCIAGVILYSSGVLVSGFVISTDPTALGILFATFGILAGSGGCLLFLLSNILPAQYFKHKLGIANGIVKAAGALGGVSLSFVIDALIRKVGVRWTFHILGLMMLATSLPAAFLMRERKIIGRLPLWRLDTLRMFRKVSFSANVLYGATNTFTLWTPLYFLPLLSNSRGYSPTVGVAFVSTFNIASIIGRLLSGVLCDSLGPSNALLAMAGLNVVSLAIVWPLSRSLGVLICFVVLNGAANGAFFVNFPTTISSLFEPPHKSLAITLAIAGWTPGYLTGSPIAGALLPPGVTGPDSKPEAYRAYFPVIFFTAGMSLMAFACAGLGRMLINRKLRIRV